MAGASIELIDEEKVRRRLDELVRDGQGAARRCATSASACSTSPAAASTRRPPRR